MNKFLTGIIAVNPNNTAEILHFVGYDIALTEILHFVGYDVVLDDNQIEIEKELLKEELSTDDELGLTDIEFVLITASPEIVEYFNNQIYGNNCQ
jgi:hypothetical protein